MPIAIQIVTLAGQPFARAFVESTDGVWHGRLDGPVGAGLATDLFTRYEAAVNDQVLSMVDGLEDEIAALGVHVLFPDGRWIPAGDLQVYPSTRNLSFRLRDATARPGAA